MNEALRHPFRHGRRRLKAKLAVVRHYPALKRNPLRAMRYLLFDPEVDNFTYDIANRHEFITFFAKLFGVAETTVAAIVAELDNDTAAAGIIRAKLHRPPYFGRRIGWYVAARIAKPAIVVETGVHDGIGSVVLLSALRRNAAEGKPGKLIGIDIRAEAGWIIPADLRERFDFRVGSSADILPALTGPIDFFLHDSDHAYDYESMEYRLVRPNLSEGAVILSDNAHIEENGLSALDQFSKANGRTYYFVPEKPARHFYPGAGIGVSLRNLAPAEDI